MQTSLNTSDPTLITMATAALQPSRTGLCYMWRLIKSCDVDRTFNEVGTLLGLQADWFSLCWPRVSTDHIVRHSKVVTHDRLVAIVDKRTTQQLWTDREDSLAGKHEPLLLMVK